MTPRLIPLQFVAGSRRQHQHENIDNLGDGRFGLARADRLDQHGVKPCRLTDQDRLARAARDTSGLSPAEDGRIKAAGRSAQFGHAGLVAEDGPAAAL